MSRTPPGFWGKAEMWISLPNEAISVRREFMPFVSKAWIS